ncbi:MAG: 1-deoxy-D-xylulose-5-phosphate reductoisomerase [Acidimicrobiales bacterium]
MSAPEGPAPRRVVIAGSTGSIGTQALEVIAAQPDRLSVAALGGGSSVKMLADQARVFKPDVVAIADQSLAGALEALVPGGTEVRAGAGALESLVDCGDIVLNAVVGFAGLGVTVEALSAGKRLALANKESLVAGAPVVQRARETAGAELIPVDSEHCAIHQCLGAAGVLPWAAQGPGSAGTAVAKLIITASGGPFRGRKSADLATVSVREALEHPTWKMGPKITVDSSTLMNKGLEVIEAHELFGVEYGSIDVVVHPQSVVHSMVAFSDGATLAQLSVPDMRLPIGYALGYPWRGTVAYGEIDWASMSRLDFEQPDRDTFACLGLAYAAGRAGGSAPAWLNAANEVAVAAFLGGRLSWCDIADVVSDTLERHKPVELATVDDVLAADAEARELASRAVSKREKVA